MKWTKSDQENPASGVRQLLALLFCVSLASCSSGALTHAKVTSSGGPDIQTARAQADDGPKARIAVADFEDKTTGAADYNPAYGRGMSDMLATSLFQTGRYIVLEREKLNVVLAEQNFGASGRVKRGTEAPIGEVEGAELLVLGAVTGWEPNASGGGGGVGGIGSGMGGGLLGGGKTARIAMDLRVVDAATGRLLAATSVEGTSTTVAGGGLLVVPPLGGGLAGYAKGPMEVAIRSALQKAVEYVVSQTPKEYLH